MTSAEYETKSASLKIMIRAEARAGRYAAIKEHLRCTEPSGRVPFDKLRNMNMDKIL